ncbi:NADH-quinone oxidoreductase subunit C [Candidatus Micrarchaeota archaeon]|nr:NADH-quinone oxidoreductase subunit C [Candidatus Micrarchaeota archaeon]MBU1165484.1 NADH-quinone oxidoreductase subunit C [Candidatus Micrarchaeota archaeon]MBU1886322.1 NADH-quinone oxidoreductase subunit C [Candidatus Micrarchaeota archaeon]
MINVLNDVKKIKAERLISIASVKNDDGNYTVYYHFSWDKKPEIRQFSIEVKKGDEVESIMELFENAALLEGEMTELFGIKFIGNPYSGKRIFLAEEGGKKCTPPFIQ